MGERNPNYVTPEEARKMSCPIMGARAADVSCVAKNCMAWHWHEYQIPVLGSESPVVWKKVVSVTYGRCGKKIIDTVFTFTS